MSETTRLSRRTFVPATWRIVMFTLLLLVPLVAACGDDGDDDPTEAAATATLSAAAASPTAESEASPTTASAASPTTADAASPTTDDSGSTGEQVDGGDPLMGFEIEEAAVEGGTLIEGTSADIQSLNPIVINDTPSANFLALIFESLIEPHPETLEPVGGLAEAWEISDDGLTWTFYLREGVTWHDGEDLTADDVRFTYELHMDEGSNSSYTGDLVSKIASIEVVDPLTIAFTLPQPYADFAVDVAVYGIIAEHVWAHVAPADVVSDPGSTGEDPARVVGTGPFIFQEWITNDHATAIAYENYWAGAPSLAEFIYKVVPDTVAGIQQLRTGEIDWLGGIPGASVQDLDDADVELAFSDTLSFAFYGYNLDPERTTLFQDAAVRQALFHALDREAMVDVIRAGYSTVAAGTIPILSWAYNPEGIDNPYPYDPDLAAQLLDEAGWVEGDDGVREKDGERLAFSMHTDASDPTSVSYVTAMQEFWAQIGVEMTPQLEPFQALVERIAVTFDYETFMIGFSWGVAPDQAAMFACDSYEGGFNVMRYCNEEVDALLAAALSEPDQAIRIELYTDFQNLLLEDLPAAILDFPQSIDGHSTRVHNLFPNAVNERFNAETWWVEE